MSGATCIRAALALELAVIVGGTHGCDLLAESNFDSLFDFDFVGVTINFEDQLAGSFLEHGGLFADAHLLDDLVNVFHGFLSSTAGEGF